MATCERCRRELVSVETTIGTESLTMHSCSVCDLRSWERDGQEIDLREVLDLTAAAAREKQRR